MCIRDSETGFWIDVPVMLTGELPAVDDELPPPLPQEWIEKAFEGEEIPEEVKSSGLPVIQTSARMEE